MLEGQDGLTWERWQRIAQTVEDEGYAGLYRSDHFTNPAPPDKESLECWVSLTWLASHTSRLEFGPLVSPVSFRHPSMLARMAAAVDDLSGGRLHLGLGAGWQDREHEHFSYDLGSVARRSARLREAAHIVSHLLRQDAPLTFKGQFYTLTDAVVLPRPKRAGGPRIVLGGAGRRLTLPLAAKYADEWNCSFRNAADFKALNAELDQLVRQERREPSDVRRTLMTGVRPGHPSDEAGARQRGLLFGSFEHIRDQVAELFDAGVQRVMLQWLDLDNLDGIKSLARALR